MKLHVDFESGPSPGIVLSGTKADVGEIGRQLSAAADAFEREEGPVPLEQLDARGDSTDWVQFRIVRDVDILNARSSRRTRSRLRLMPLWILVGLGVLYLIYRGALAVLA